MTIFFFALIGAAAGILAGLLGLGGGVVVVPGLALVYDSFHFPPEAIMHMAAGTSLAAMIVTAIASTYSHYRRGAVLWSVFSHLAPGLVMGTILGAILAHFLSTKLLATFFGIFLFILSIRMFLLFKPKPTRAMPGMWGTSAVGLGIGILSGMLGVGGGAPLVPFMTYCNISIREATGTSAACGFPIAVIGTLAFIITGWNSTDLPWTSGYVYWPAALMIALFSVVFVHLGAKLALRLPVRMLQRVFAVILALMGVGLIISS